MDPTILAALRTIASSKAPKKEATMDKEKYFLDYAASKPDSILYYSASDMVLAAHRDASYLTEPKVRSRAGGHFFMPNNSENPANSGVS